MFRIAILIAILGYSNIVWSCSCAPNSPSSKFESADAVFYASVSNIKQNPSACGPDRDGVQVCRRDFIVSYDSLTLLTGEIPEHEYLFTRAGAACGARLETGREYLFMAHVWNGEIRLSGCGNTIEKNSIQEEQFWKHIKLELGEETMEYFNANGHIWRQARKESQ